MRALVLAVTLAACNPPLEALEKCDEYRMATDCRANHKGKVHCHGSVAMCRVDDSCSYAKSNPDIWTCRQPGLEAGEGY